MRISAHAAWLVGLVIFLGLAGCASRPAPPPGVQDPFEADNRAAHAFNKDLDRVVLRPVSRAYVRNVPDEGQQIVSNVADNLALPGMVVNNLLQGDLSGAGRNSLRFLYNTTLGFGGMFDPSSEFGIEPEDTDFGETLHVWGVPEGNYVELLVFGPSTERDALGRVVDFALDPLDYLIPSPERRYGTGVYVLDRVGDRGRFGDTVDSVLYDSADSYAQARIIYLQNRRSALGQTEGVAPEDEIDPFELDTEGF